MGHQYLEGAGEIPHTVIDARLPTAKEKHRLATVTKGAPVTVSGARDDPEAALASLLSALEQLGLIADNTTAT